MEFWGEEVKSGQPLKVVPGDGLVIHLSQACIGEQKKVKGNENINLFVNVDGKKLVLGTLLTEKLPQQQFDLVFEKDFEITHNWKNGSVYVCGYRATNPYDDEESFDATKFPGGESDDTDSEEEPIQHAVTNNGQPESKAKSNAGKNKVKIVEPSKSSDDDDSEVMEDDSDEDDSDESEEETPVKVESSKKRAPESATKTPVSSKKAKTTPQKTDGKKVSGHVATPHPAKGKTPANKQNQQTPKSGGAHVCGSCNRSFKTDEGLDSHSKAKHGGAK